MTEIRPAAILDSRQAMADQAAVDRRGRAAGCSAREENEQPAAQLAMASEVATGRHRMGELMFTLIGQLLVAGRFAPGTSYWPL